MMNWRRAIRPLLGTIIAAVFVWLTFEQLDWLAFRQSLAQARSAPLLLAFLLLAVEFSLRIVRWWWMLQVFEPRLSLANCVGPLLASFAVDNLLPFPAGDLFRAVGFRRELKSPVARTLATVLVERLLDVSVLLGFLLFGLLVLPSRALPGSFVTAAVWFALIGLFIIMAVLITPQLMRQLLYRIERWPIVSRRPFALRLCNLAAKFLTTVVAFNSLRLIAQLIGFSILVWTFEGAIFASVAWALSADVSAFGPWFALATGTLATVLPSTPGNLGTFDYFATVGLMAYGAQKAPAVAFSLLVHLLLWLPITLVGALCLVATMGRSLSWRVRLDQG